MPISVPARLRPLTRREWWWAAAGVLVGVALLAACWLLVVLAMPQFPDIDSLGVGWVFSPELWTAMALIGLVVLTRAVVVGWLVGVAVGVLLTALGPATGRRRAAAVLAPFVGAGCAVALVLFVG